MPIVEMHVERMKRQNKYVYHLRAKLVEMFGGKCEDCSATQKDLDELEKPKKLHFAHKVGFRFGYGMSRGKNHRVLAVKKNPERFRLLCPACHLEYDRSNPITGEEKILQQKEEDERVPF
jgi:hypothetical protein